MRDLGLDVHSTEDRNPQNEFLHVSTNPTNPLGVRLFRGSYNKLPLSLPSPRASNPVGLDRSRIFIISSEP